MYMSRKNKQSVYSGDESNSVNISDRGDTNTEKPIANHNRRKSRKDKPDQESNNINEMDKSTFDSQTLLKSVLGENVSFVKCNQCGHQLEKQKLISHVNKKHPNDWINFYNENNNKIDDKSSDWYSKKKPFSSSSRETFNKMNIDQNTCLKKCKGSYLCGICQSLMHKNIKTVEKHIEDKHKHLCSQLNNTIYLLKDKDHMEIKQKFRYFCQQCLHAVVSLKEIWDHCKKNHPGKEALALKTLKYDDLKQDVDISDNLPTNRKENKLQHRKSAINTNEKHDDKKNKEEQKYIQYDSQDKINHKNNKIDGRKHRPQKRKAVQISKDDTNDESEKEPITKKKNNYESKKIRDKNNSDQEVSCEEDESLTIIRNDKLKKQEKRNLTKNKDKSSENQCINVDESNSNNDNKENDENKDIFNSSSNLPANLNNAFDMAPNQNNDPSFAFSDPNVANFNKNQQNQINPNLFDTINNPMIGFNVMGNMNQYNPMNVNNSSFDLNDQLNNNLQNINNMSQNNIHVGENVNINNITNNITQENRANLTQILYISKSRLNECMMNLQAQNRMFSHYYQLQMQTFQNAIDAVNNIMRAGNLFNKK